MGAAKLGIILGITAMILLVGILSNSSAHSNIKANDVLFPKTSLAEVGTGTWCTYCPGAEGALNKLANEMSLNQLAIVEYHDDDSYSSVDNLCSDRLDFYSVPGIPEAFFSGENAALGGSTDANDPDVYNWYKSKINNDLQNETGVVIGMDTDVEGSNLNITVTVLCGETPTDNNLYLEVMLIYDENITVTNSGRTYYIRYSALKWIMDDPITLSKGDVLIRHYNTTLDSSWDVSKLNVVAFVQTHNTHDVTDNEGYSWKEAKVYNSAIQPIEKWEIEPSESEINATIGNMYELNTTLHNELSETRKITVGYDPATVPSGWSVEICVGGICYDTSEVNITLQPGESRVVYYHITPGDSQTAYIKTYATGNQWYSDIHYIKVNSTTVPELNFTVMPILIAVGAIVLLRMKSLS